MDVIAGFPDYFTTFILLFQYYMIYRFLLFIYLSIENHENYFTMKYFSLILLSIVFYTNVSAQWVNSITIAPAQPTTADTIVIIIENVFPSGGCDGTTTLTGISGSIIQAQGTHCIGMLTVICTDYDTLIIPPQTLPIGTYSFAYTLLTGSGFPCAFGSLPVIDTVVNFNVNPATTVNEIHAAEMNIFPNPSRGKFVIKQNSPETRVKIYSTDGRILLNFLLKSPETEINSNLKPGVYILAYERNGVFGYSKLVIEK